MANAFYEKLVGAILLLAGLAIIGYGISFASGIFLNGKNPPEIFSPLADPPKAGNPTINSALPKNLNEINPDDLQKMIMDNVLGSGALSSVIPPEMFNYLPKMLNLSALGIFLWILIIAGAKVSSLGIVLIKTSSNIKI
ncbi:hypothetical protein KKG29_00535 [Patescibacteria group bacterium]|nr:hypothetical protein [Patescibacteria group bacterium]MBU3999654.1 hypothetical protein [Patescibacteria group bacterium]MBU4057169.1 hypothetical protein [Patescibacteria group bacterium]MBU4368999.1 hypothetical protein [Patescibacteria group bacterium]